MDIALTISNRQISPAVVNLFQFENGTTTLNFTLDSYMYGEVNLRNYKAYAITSINGNIDMTELVMSYDASKDKLTLSWNVKEFTLLEAGAVVYQIVFKEATASGIPDEGENTGVFYSYKAILINREAVDADNEISAKYPTILKQWLDRMNSMAEMYDVGAVYMKYGQSIPPADRLAGKLYVQYTDTLNTRAQFEDEKGNILGEYDVMHLVGDETIAGQKSFTTSPKVPTPSADDNSTNAANTEFVKNAIDDGFSDFDGKYLPRSGGAMTVAKAMHRDVNDSFLGLHGGTGENNDGAQVYLCGANHPSNPGSFQLHARNSEIDQILEGKLDGTLLWMEKYVLCNAFSMPHNNSGINLNSGTDYASGAYVRLYAKESTVSPGSFIIGASDGTGTMKLQGWANGSLTWNEKEVITNAGGKIEGEFVRNGLLARTTASTQSLWATAGTSTSDGASFYLYGSTSSNGAGVFKIRAHDGTNYTDLIGYPDGGLSWDGYIVLTASNANKEKIANYAMPSKVYQGLTLGSSGSVYTAPADGYVSLAATFSTAGVLYIYRGGTPRYGHSIRYNASEWVDATLYLSSGETVTVNYNGTATTVHAFNFIYANGSKHLRYE